MAKLWRITDPEVVAAIKDYRYVEVGKRRNNAGYAGVVSRHWQVDGKDWFEIDVNCIGGVPAPLAKRPMGVFRGWLNRLRTGG